MIILDTETTGLGEEAEIVEITIIDSWSIVWMNTLVKPTKPIPKEATAIHGITDAMVEYAPTFAQIAGAIEYILSIHVQDDSDFHSVAAYNAAFDKRMLVQSGYDKALPDFVCVMEKFVHTYSLPTKHYSLANAAKNLSLSFDGLKPHRAASDCAVTLDVLRVINGLNPVATGDSANAFNERVRKFNESQIFIGR